MSAPGAVARWLAPAVAVTGLTPAELEWLAAFEADVVAQLAGAPAWPASPGRRGEWLLAVRRWLAGRHPVVTADSPPSALRQLLAQFVCGFHDLDLRDAYGPGHGSLVLASATPATRSIWSARLATGELVGIAATEARGGSRFREITTAARRISPTRWTLSGEKCWVSRLTEAAGLVIFFRDPGQRLSAAIVDAERPGFVRELREPAGLAGWSWGILRLADVPIDPARDLLAGPGQGERLFRWHFAAFRPLVAATALGAAAGVHGQVAASLADRLRTGVVKRVRDQALIVLGRVHAELSAALLAAVATSHLVATGAAPGDLWARVGKAHAVDTAHRAVTELALLVGAVGFQAGSPLVKAQRDLAALRYADGIHDSLYRSGGRSLLGQQEDPRRG